MSETTMSHSPAVYGAVAVNTNFMHDDETYVARGLWASGDGTITVTREDGTTMANKQVFRGVNVFRCTQVTNLGGLTLEWFA